MDTSIKEIIDESPYLSRDLSWLMFNYRVLQQAKSESRTITERLKFIAITESNLDEFFMVRVGSLYKYLDYDRERIDYSGLREDTFKATLFDEIKTFVDNQSSYFENELKPLFKSNGFDFISMEELTDSEMKRVLYYFSNTIYPMLTPMVYDELHTFPVLQNKYLIFGVITKDLGKKSSDDKISFVQIPNNLPRFYEIERNGEIFFLPLEEIIRSFITKLYKNVEICSCNLFRITRNADFDYEEYDESENEFLEELRKKLKGRRTGRVVRLEVEQSFSDELIEILNKKFKIDSSNVIRKNSLLNYNHLWTIVKNKELAGLSPRLPKPIRPLGADKKYDENILEYLKHNDLLLHHPYNSMDPVIHLLEQAADDPDVLSIKITIYRLAENSRISNALLRAAEKGKNVAVLFEVKARFDEENNLNEGRRLEKAGCFVVYGFSQVKTHTKLMMIVRKDRNNITRYVHMSSGNYNEDTARLYTDTGYLTTNRVYGNDISEFFNVITGHSSPDKYQKLITTPGDMRKKIIYLIRKESLNAKKGIDAKIILKVNSLEDREVIDELYKASNAGVKINLIVRGICCLRPGRKKLSENIEVISVVGDYLEHSRIFYFQNGGLPKIYGGSADIMVRSFDKRIESLFLAEGFAAQQMMAILDYNLLDNVNSFRLEESGEYSYNPDYKNEFNIHKEFYLLDKKKVKKYIAL